MKKINSILYSEFAPLNRDITCFKLQKDVKNMGDKKLSVKPTFKATKRIQMDL